MYQHQVKIQIIEHREKRTHESSAYAWIACSLIFSNFSQETDIDGRLKHTNNLKFCQLSDVSFFSMKLDVSIKRTIPVFKMSLTKVLSFVSRPTPFFMYYECWMTLRNVGQKFSCLQDQSLFIVATTSFNCYYKLKCFVWVLIENS